MFGNARALVAADSLPRSSATAPRERCARLRRGLASSKRIYYVKEGVWRGSGGGLEGIYRSSLDA
eukprot:477067-Prorocentrum_minimum.AAC.1